MIIFQALYGFFLPGFRVLNMKGMSQRKFDRNRIKYSQMSSLDGARSANGEEHPGGCPSLPTVPWSLVQGVF